MSENESRCASITILPPEETSGGSQSQGITSQQHRTLSPPPGPPPRPVPSNVPDPEPSTDTRNCYSVEADDESKAPHFKATSPRIPRLVKTIQCYRYQFYTHIRLLLFYIYMYCSVVLQPSPATSLPL